MQERPAVAGFVLAGGESSRMGRNKALLATGGVTLVEHVAGEISTACGRPASVLGDPSLYAHLGLAVVPDLIPARGPMSGLHAALNGTEAEWILLCACDLPNIDAGFLRELIASAKPGVRCVAADGGERGLEPLCAVYHRSTLVEVEAALREDRLRMRDLVACVGAVGVKADRRLVRNVNTEEDWRLHLAERHLANKDRLH